MFILDLTCRPLTCALGLSEVSQSACRPVTCALGVSEVNQSACRPMTYALGVSAVSQSACRYLTCALGLSEPIQCLTVKNLCVTFDCHLSMKTYISSLVHSANFELSRISSVRHLLPTDATKPLFLPFFFCTLTTAILSCLSVLSITLNELQISLCLESAQP